MRYGAITSGNKLIKTIDNYEVKDGQKLKNAYEQPIAVLSEGWMLSKIYYDPEQNRFINEKWHYEYLDTDTVCDGRFEMSDIELWEKLVDKADEKGINAFLNIRKTIPKVQENPPFLSTEDFRQQLYELGEKPFNYRLLIIGDTYIVQNEKNQNIGILTKTPYYYAYVDQGSSPKGFHSLEKALSYVMSVLFVYHRRRLPNPPPLEKPIPPGSQKVKSAEIPKKPRLIDKLLGKKRVKFK